MIINLDIDGVDYVQAATDAGNKHLAMLDIESIIDMVTKHGRLTANILTGIRIPPDGFRLIIRRYTSGKPSKANGVPINDVEAIVLATALPWDTVRHHWHAIPPIYILYNAQTSKTIIEYGELK